MKKIKIIYINTRYYSREFVDESDKYFYLFGIGHVLAWELLKNCPEIEVENWRADHTVKKDLVKKVDGIVCRVFKGSATHFFGTFSFSLIRALRRIIKGDEYHVLIHFHGMHSIGFNLISWLIPKVPIVATHHGGGNFSFKYFKNKKIKTFFAEKLDRFSIKKRFDHAFVQTETEIKYLAGILPVEKYSRFTPFGFDFDAFRPMDRIAARNKLAIPVDKKIILSVARADSLKGVHHVLKVFKELNKEKTDLELVCVDILPGDLYYDQVRESGARIFGRIFYYDLPVYYAAADVLVYLPFDDESLNFAGPGYVTAEALACGIPVVSSLLVHFWDASINEVARIPKDLDQAILMTRDLLNNPPDAGRCREIAYRFYNWNYVMDGHLKVYDQLLNEYYNTCIPQKNQFA